MIKFLSVPFLFFFSNLLLAETTPAPVVAGSIVNTWTQAGLRVTDKPFDLGIQGNGFFVLQLPNGLEAFSRYGEMSLNSDGFLVHGASEGKILGYCGGEIEPINLSRFTHDRDGSTAQTFKIELSGSIMAFYENGYAHETCRLALALFQNSSRLQRKQHILTPTTASGEAVVGTPQSEGRGSIYSASLEELDEQMYRLNIKSGNVDRVAAEIEKARVASEQWSKQKTLFYVYDLGVTRSELSEIEASTEKCGNEIQRIVAIVEKAPSQISADEFSSRIRLVVTQHESEVLDVLGQERLDKTKKFREDFNRDVWAKFGTTLRFTAF